MKIIIDEGHKGFLFRNGAFVKMLGAGKYRTFGGNKILLGEIGKGRIVVEKLNLLLFEKDEAFRACTLCERVKNGEISLHFVDGVLFEVLQAGKYYFWKESGEHTFLHVDLSSTEVKEASRPRRRRHRDRGGGTVETEASASHWASATCTEPQRGETRQSTLR